MADALMPVSGSTVTNSHHCTNTFILLQDVFPGEEGVPIRNRRPGALLLAGTSIFHGSIQKQAFLAGRKVVIMTDVFFL